jgi:hypothetical protein
VIASAKTMTVAIGGSAIFGIYFAVRRRFASRYSWRRAEWFDDLFRSKATPQLSLARSSIDGIEEPLSLFTALWELQEVLWEYSPVQASLLNLQAAILAGDLSTGLRVRSMLLAVVPVRATDKLI